MACPPPAYSPCSSVLWGADEEEEVELDLNLNGGLTLTQAIDLALEHNLDLKIERTRMDDSQHELDAAKSEFDVSVGSTGDTGFRLSPGTATQLDGSPRPESRDASVRGALDKKLRTGATVGITTDILNRAKTNSSFRTLNPTFTTSARIQVRQPILKNAGFRYNLSNIKLAKLGIDESNFLYYQQLFTLLRETENGYWEVVGAEIDREITERSIELSELLVEEAEERKKAALATETDVLEAKSSLAERQELLLETSSRVETARDELFRSLGLLRVANPLIPGFESLPPRVHLICNPTASFALAEDHAPVLLAAKVQSDRQRTQVTRQKNQLLPQLDLTASTGALGLDGTFSRAHQSLRDLDGHTWEAGFELRIPLGNRFERARLAQAKNELTRARLAEENVRLDLYAVVRAACREVEVARKSFDAAQITLEFTELRLEQQRENYRQGQVTIRDLLEAQNDLDAARFRRVQARIRELRAVVQLAEVEGTLPSRYGNTF